MSTDANRGKKRIFADLVALHQSITSGNVEPSSGKPAAEPPSAEELAVEAEIADNGYELFCEHLPMGVMLAEVTRDRYRHPTGFTPVKVNMAYARMVGLARVSVLEREFFEVLPGGEADWKESLTEVAEKGRVAQGMAYWDATDMHVQVTLFLPRRDLLAVVIEDAGARPAMGASVARHTEALDDILQASPDMVCRFLPDGTLTYANRAYCEYFKKIREELVGHSFLEEIPQDSVEFVRSRLGVLTRANPVITYQHRFEDEAGSRWVEWTDVALFDDNGELVAYQSHGRDVTAQRQEASETAQVAGYMEDLLHYRTKLYSVVETQATETTRSSEVLSEEVEELRAEVIRLQGRTVTGDLDVCSSCNRIHDEEDHWMVVPLFLESHTAARVGSQVCPYCRSKAERELERQGRKRKRK
jgi:PAS domain S-box-containing protein